MLGQVWDTLLGRTKSRGRRAEPNRLDKLQAAADVAGVADQSGITDLVNAGVSVIRGLKAKGSDERRAHFKDALIRGISAIPVVGDLAKLARSKEYAKVFKSVSSGGRRAATSGKAAAVGGSGSRGWFSAAKDLFKGDTQALSERFAGAGSGRQPQGLTGAEKMSMMGKSSQEIEAADAAKRARDELTIKEEDAKERLGELVEKVKAGTKGFGALIVAIAVLPKLTQRWGESIVDSRRQLAIYNGRLAGAIAQLDISRIRNDIAVARNTGGSSAATARALQDLERSMRPLRDMKTTLENGLATGVIKIAELHVMALAELANKLGVEGLVKKLEKWLGAQGKVVDDTLAAQFVNELLRQEGKMAGRRAPLPPL